MLKDSKKWCIGCIACIKGITGDTNDTGCVMLEGQFHPNSGILFRSVPWNVWDKRNKWNKKDELEHRMIMSQVFHLFHSPCGTEQDFCFAVKILESINE